MYVDAENKRADQNFEMLETCILTSLSPGTRAKLHSIYENFNIGGMVYVELVFKGLTNKAIFENKQTTPYLQDHYDNLPSYMTTCDSGIAKSILEWRNLVRLLEAHSVVL